MLQVEAGVWELVNDAGAWVGTSSKVTADAGPANADTVLLVGEGVFEGLAAYLVVDFIVDPAIQGCFRASSTPARCLTAP